MKKRSEYIILAAVILLVVAGNFVDIRIPFLDDSPLGDFLGKAATIYFPILPLVMLKLNYKDWKEGRIDTLGMIIVSFFSGIAFIILAVASGVLIAAIE